MTLTTITDKAKQQQKKIQKPVEKQEEQVYVTDRDTCHIYTEIKCFAVWKNTTKHSH